ncbi:MAG: ATP phosphoribosyltransferase regulatory subunit, partial [Lentisphaeraceae bacterium]|nr:ATP phosphoribosyltransferase regulatory subunit [Lentisphaeraceae bacterium]
INNRKLLEGYYLQQGIEDMNKVLIAVDKIDKIGEEGVIKLLLEENLSEEQAQACVDLAKKKFTIKEGLAFLEELECENDMLIQAKVELKSIFNNLSHLPEEAVIFDLSIARGLDYYTGSVYECTLKGLEQYGSVCSGGRYDDLASKFTKRKLPGVGLSIGITRLLYILFDSGRLELMEPTPTQAVVILFKEEERPSANKVAAELRSAGINTEVSYLARKFAKQIQHAEKRGARFIVIPEEDGTIAMKDLKLGEQSKLDINKMLSALKGES